MSRPKDDGTAEWLSEEEEERLGTVHWLKPNRHRVSRDKRAQRQDHNDRVELQPNAGNQQRNP